MVSREEHEKLRSKLWEVVASIEDIDVMEFTLHLLLVAPASFWTKPASRRHHPEDERGECGNLIHTIRVTKAALILCDIPDITGISRDMVASAALLHDTCRYGLDGESDRSVPEHAQLVRKLAQRHEVTCKYAEPIFKMVEGHMGRWGVSAYIPRIDAVSIIHIADCVCARISEVLNRESW